MEFSVHSHVQNARLLSWSTGQELFRPRQVIPY
jgi:hypothetical protein